MIPRGSDTTLDSLLEFVRDTRGFDFTGYKRSSVQRRVAKRMADLGIERYEDYLDQLQLNSDEFVELFNTILINVTGFFRDPRSWEYYATSIIPQLLSSRPADAPIRVWSAGCASGEEAYTIAMVLARVMGESQFRERVKIYATDVDEDALDRGPPRQRTRRGRSRTCRGMRSSASSSAQTSATCSARTSAAA